MRRRRARRLDTAILSSLHGATCAERRHRSEGVLAAFSLADQEECLSYRRAAGPARHCGRVVGTEHGGGVITDRRAVLVAYVGLGSNLGDRAATLRAARARLSALPGVQRGAVSPVYETEPWGDADQPFFLNQVMALECNKAVWSAERLLPALLDIENALGRVRGPRRFGPRTLDLDLLLFGGQTIAAADLVVPHPRLRQRAFVLVPLADIAPDLPIPDGEGGTVAQALSKIPFKLSGNILQIPTVTGTT